ncbi:hypothetical protein [Citrobacter braakii]
MNGKSFTQFATGLLTAKAGYRTHLCRMHIITVFLAMMFLQRPQFVLHRLAGDIAVNMRLKGRPGARGFITKDLPDKTTGHNRGLVDCPVILMTVAPAHGIDPFKRRFRRNFMMKNPLQGGN